MLLIEFQFPAGRFHATPWGRNVNEGVVEWPPSPFRLARALVDVCKKRHPDWSDERLEAVLQALACLPSYHLPNVTASHTRSYLSSNARDSSMKQKIFDSFVAVDKTAKLVVGFDAVVPPEVLTDLGDLLFELNYLGRSESWVKARLLDPSTSVDFNCKPVSGGEKGPEFETIKLACLKTQEDYHVLPKRPERKKGKGKKAANEPLSWLEAVCLSTKELLGEGWSSPPGMTTVSYYRSVDAFRAASEKRRRGPHSRFNTAKYVLHGSVLPLVTDTVVFAERVRVKLMGTHKRIMAGDESAVSPIFSGKSEAGRAAAGHRHAYILPLDEDGDGRLDHLIVKAADPFTKEELQTLDHLRSVWQKGSRPDVSLVLTSLTKEVPGLLSKSWVSATPFVTARRHRKGRGTYEEWLKEEVKKECRFHGLPEPDSIEWIDRTKSAGHPIRWMEFVRSRKGSNPLRGHGCVLRFTEPVLGPFAIGALSHFGLGSFVAETTVEK